MCSTCLERSDWSGKFHLGNSINTAETRQYIGSTSQGSSGSALVDGMLSGVKWFGSTVSYNFAASAGGYGDVVAYDDTVYDSNNQLIPERSNSPTHNFAQLTAEMQTVSRGAFAAISAYTNLTFVEMSATATGSTVDISFGQTTSTETAFAYSPSSLQKGGDIWMGRGATFATTGDQYANPTLGDYKYMTFLHEIGHAMGLKHSHENGGIAGAVIESRDAMEFTLMSYRSVIGGTLLEGYSNEEFGYAQSFMMLDIAALQEMYGADYTTNATDSVYSFNSATGEMLINGVGQGTPGDNRIFRTIWDGNGNDTYDTSNYAENQNVNLQAGGWSLFSLAERAELNTNAYARANTYNAMLFDDDTRSLIENATTGSGNDTLGGNQVANILNGQNGNDRIVGQGGNDELIGGGGDDFLYGDFDLATPLAIPPAAPYTFGGGYATISQGTVRNSAATAINMSGNVSLAFDSDIENSTTHAHSTINVTANGSADWFKVSLNATNRLTIDIDHTSSGYDGYVRFFAADGVTLLDSNDDNEAAIDLGSTTMQDPFKTFTATTTGTYYIVVGTYQAVSTISAGNTYELNVSTNITPIVVDLPSTVGVAGDDVLNGGSGNDTLVGGLGNDTYIIDSNLDSIVELVGQGVDTVLSPLAFMQLDAGNTLENLTYTGTAGGILYGNSLVNVLTGGAQSDSFNGFFGGDVYYGGDGNDYFYIDEQDFFNGGNGTDAVFIQTLVGTTLNLGASFVEYAVGYTGNDTLNGSTSTISVALLGGGGNDTLRGGAANDYLYIDSLDTVIDAGGGTNDVIVVYNETNGVNLNITAANAEYVIGGGGADTLNATGSLNAVVIQGGAGADIITGGNASDYLYGNAGADIFRVTSNAQFDAIFDFIDAGGSEDDKIDLRSLGTNFDTLAEVLAVTSESGGTSVINFGSGNQLYLYQVVKAVLAADDFIFS